jgi:hypothetical protein
LPANAGRRDGHVPRSFAGDSGLTAPLIVQSDHLYRQ